jgi:predicted RecA/RadA family phage recombinase
MKMPLAVFVSEGKAVDYTPTTDVAAGDVVVQGELVGIAKRPIPANTPGALAVTGVFDMPKATGVGSGLAVGIEAFWDATNKVVTATAGTNKFLGKTVRAAADGDDTVRVRLKQ